jgi:HD superfamily phosphohydrolase
LQGLISGSLDLGKIQARKRDAFMCGSLTAEIDVDHFSSPRSHSSRKLEGCLGVQEALSALESLLFAKYQIYRNVYWHHAVKRHGDVQATR